MGAAEYSVMAPAQSSQIWTLLGVSPLTASSNYLSNATLPYHVYKCLHWLKPLMNRSAHLSSQLAGHTLLCGNHCVIHDALCFEDTVLTFSVLEGKHAVQHLLLHAEGGHSRLFLGNCRKCLCVKHSFRRCCLLKESWSISSCVTAQI